MLDLDPSSGEAMTGDLNLLRIQVTVQYRAARPVDYVLHCEDVERLLRKAAESSVSARWRFAALTASCARDASRSHSTSIATFRTFQQYVTERVET